MPRTERDIPTFTRILVNHDPEKGHTKENGCRWSGLITCHTKGGMRLAAINPNPEGVYPVMAITDVRDKTVLLDKVPPITEYPGSIRKCIRHISETLPETLRRTEYDCTKDVEPTRKAPSGDGNYVHPIHQNDRHLSTPARGYADEHLARTR